MSSFSQVEAGIPRSVYYPSMVVNLQIRLDEGLTLIPGARTAAKLAEDGGSFGSAKEPVVLRRGSDNFSKVTGIVPRSASVELPGYRQAGKFNVELEFRDLPLDPRVIRAMGVAIHLGAVEAGAFGDGMSIPRPYGDSRFDSVERPASVVEADESNLVLAGLADSVYVEHTRSGSLVKMDGRDLRGILLDYPVTAETLKGLDVKRPIDEVVSHLVGKLHPLGLGIKVEVNRNEWPKGIPAPSSLEDVTRLNLDAVGRALRPNAKGEVQKVTFWDLITQYCFLVGAVPYFVGSRMRIRPARNLFDQRLNEFAFDPSFATPFKGGKRREVRSPIVEKAEKFSYRRLVFGKDVDRLSFERKLAGVKVPVVEVASYDSGSAERGKDGRLIRVQFPPEEKKEARTTDVGPSGDAPATNAIRVNVPGIKNKDKLLEIAKDLYEEVGRQEMGGSVETKNLSSFGGSNQDPDLLKLRPGDPVEFRVDASGLGNVPPPISELTNSDARSFEEQVKEVKGRLGDENLARALVAANRGEIAELQRTFRASNVHFTWGKDSGVAIAFDFQNFVEARYALEDEVAVPSVGTVVA